MKNKFTSFLLVFVMLFSFAASVNAEEIAQAAVKGVQSDELFNSLKDEYDNGIVEMPISQENQEVIVYGHSICSADSGCDYTYQGVESSEVEELLASAVSCSDGSTSINYSLRASTAAAYKSSSYEYDHEVYWSEIYTVTCTSDGTLDIGDSGSDGSVDDDDSDDYVEQGGSSGSGSGSSGSGSGSGSGYESSTAEDNVDTGVETYYIILIVVAIVSYAIMKVVKKYNLFKNI